MLSHVRSVYPREGCGLLAGHNGQVLKWIPATNVHPQPEIRYRIDDRELYEAHREMDRQGWDLLAIFHSHPTTEAYPSRTDVAQAYYPESLYLICSLVNPQQPILKGYWIRDGKIVEHPVEVL